MALEIGLDQMVGDDRRLVLAAAGGGEDAPRDAAQLGMVNNDRHMVPLFAARWMGTPPASWGHKLNLQTACVSK